MLQKTAMTQYINCGYARVAVRELAKKNSSSQGHIQFSAEVIGEYNTLFNGYPNMQLSGNSKYTAEKCKALNTSFSRKWPNQEKMHEYISTFSTKNWDQLSTTEKGGHTREACPICPAWYQDLALSFPGSRKRVLETSQIVNVHMDVVQPDTTLPPTKLAKRIGENIVTSLDPGCKTLTGMSLATVLQRTPSAGVSQRKTKSERKKENRNRLRSVKAAIETELQQRDTDLLLKNRLSFNKYNAIRLSESYETRDEAVKRTQGKALTSRMHGRSSSSLSLDETSLLAEASTWSEDQKINWTKLAEQYGVEGANRGQTIKQRKRYP